MTLHFRANAVLTYGGVFFSFTEHNDEVNLFAEPKHQ